MQARTIDCTEALFEQVIAHMMQPSSRLPQGRLDDHDSAVRCEKWQKLADNRSPLCRRVGRGREQFIQAIRHDHEIIRPAPHYLLTKVAFEWILQIALDTAETCVGYSHLLTIGIPQPFRITQWCVGCIDSQDLYSFRPIRTAMPQPIQQGYGSSSWATTKVEHRHRAVWCFMTTVVRQLIQQNLDFGEVHREKIR